jgi:transcriptional regulator with XRE-family HTH domain
MRLACAIFSRRLAAVRIDRGLTQAELAAAINVSRQKISCWENGGTNWVDITDVRRCARALRCRVKDLAAPADALFPSLDPSLRFRFKRRLKQHPAERTPKPQRGRRSPSVSAGGKNRADEIVFRTLLGAIRNTLDPNAVAAVIRELSAEHGPVLVNAVLKAVELRLDNERKTFAAARAMPPEPPTIAADLLQEPIAISPGAESC